MDAASEKSTVQELGLLAAALEAHVRRRRFFGERRARKPSAQLAPSAPAAAARSAPARTNASDPSKIAPAASATPTKAAATPRAPTMFAAEPTRRSTSPLIAAALERAEELRKLARESGDLAELARRVAECTACGLCSTRTQTVFADGRARVPVMFVGEAPGEQEDLKGLPFVGRAGQLLTDIITKGMGLAREDVYIANVLKCRPPDNRDPSEVEKLLCTPWLDRQIELVDPKVIIPLGRHAAMHVLKVEAPMNQLRGRIHRFGGRTVVPTYHPAYLLRDPSKKKDCWQDIQLAMNELGLPPVGRARPGETR